MQTKPKVSEKRIALTMSAEELSDLDAYCAEGRRQTGEPFARAEVIRMAIARLLEAVPSWQRAVDARTPFS